MKQVLMFIIAFLTIWQGELHAIDDFRERVYVQTDKQLYLAGELLWMKLCLTDESGQPASFSKVAYVELLDRSGAVAQAKVDMKNGVGEGWLELPALLPTGYYSLVAYTRYMRNEGNDVFFRKNIGVVNTFKANESIPADSFCMFDDAKADAVNNTVRLSLDKSTFSKREKGHISLRDLPADIHTLALSVAGSEFVPVPGQSSIDEWKASLANISNHPLADDFIPEYEGHIISGRVISADGDSSGVLSGFQSLLGFVGDNMRVYGGQSRPDGSMLFYTNRIDGMKELATTTYSSTGARYRVDVEYPFVIHPSQDLPKFRLNPLWREKLTARHVALQATRVFMADSFGHVATTMPHLLPVPYKSYLMDEWTRFPTMSQSVFEFVESVSFRNRDDGKHSLFVLLSDLSNQTVSLNYPLVLLDGIPVIDHEQLYDYNPALIKRLDVYRNRYAFGGQVFEGILAFYTKKGDYEGLKLDGFTQLFDYEGTQLRRIFYSPSYDDASSKSSRMPDYRHTLLWIPFVETDGAVELDIPFYTSDLSGEYTVNLEGLTRDGKPLKAVARFKVE